MATLVSPSRHGRPKVSAMMMPRRWPVRVPRPSRSPRAERSESSGRRQAVSASTLDWSTPAFAQTSPWWVSTMSTPLSFRTTRRLSRRITSTRRGSRPISSATAWDSAEGVMSPSLNTAPLGLGDDLLTHHEQISGGQGSPLGGGRLGDEAAEVVAHVNLGQALDADDLVAWRHAQVPPRWAASRAGTPSERRSPALRVSGPRSRSRARSSGASMSRPRPGRWRTTG